MLTRCCRPSYLRKAGNSSRCEVFLEREAPELQTQVAPHYDAAVHFLLLQEHLSPPDPLRCGHIAEMRCYQFCGQTSPDLFDPSSSL